MDYTTACMLLSGQHKRLKKLNNHRFNNREYEFRCLYCPGFAPMFIVECRAIGKRNFKYLLSADVSSAADQAEALKIIEDEIKKKGF